MTIELPEFVDKMVGGEVRDPYPWFAEKRRDEPVWFGTFLTSAMLPGGLEPREDWMVFRYEDCSRVLRAARDVQLYGLRRHHRPRLRPDHARDGRS